jgi:hypothetical protein
MEIEEMSHLVGNGLCHVAWKSPINPKGCITLDVIGNYGRLGRSQLLERSTGRATMVLDTWHSRPAGKE